MTKKFKSLKNAPKIGQTYYLLTPDGGSCFYMELTWEGEINEYHWLKSHRVYATEKAVKRAAKFIKRFITSHNAKADKATLINGGNIGGNIAFKCLYTDSNFYAQIFRAS